MTALSVECAIREAVRLLRESSRHFKSRQVGEARRLLEQALTEMEHHEMSKKLLGVKIPEHLRFADLQSLRASLGLSQQQLAERIGVQRNTVSRWEMGERPV